MFRMKLVPASLIPDKMFGVEVVDLQDETESTHLLHLVQRPDGGYKVNVCWAAGCYVPADEGRQIEPLLPEYVARGVLGHFDIWFTPWWDLNNGEFLGYMRRIYPR